MSSLLWHIVDFCVALGWRVGEYLYSLSIVDLIIINIALSVMVSIVIAAIMCNVSPGPVQERGEL